MCVFFLKVKNNNITNYRCLILLNFYHKHIYVQIFCIYSIYFFPRVLPGTDDLSRRHLNSLCTHQWPGNCICDCNYLYGTGGHSDGWMVCEKYSRLSTFDLYAVSKSLVLRTFYLFLFNKVYWHKWLTDQTSNGIMYKKNQCFLCMFCYWGMQ